ncbi:hypothetical protein DCC85_14235 [Paenibacillus sp. CAA11]|uniref:hypothetical protein n=1 Tax=Paenibacillus sp. CAA11 TaxID=1532905 RepID=UPI000D372C5B|nr:hypothetical protein [Paenibacillus sp. CAA11]AWB45268.1 hypothetical protein DCC85_14235 [Paenibacillus sp. CAA11]
MIKECVLLNGQVINIGPWDYQKERVLINPGEDEPLFEERINNPLPEDAEIVEMEVTQSEDGGWYAKDYLPQPSELDRMGAEIVARELEALELRQQNEILGQQIVQRELEATDLKAQNEALGGQIVGLELRVLTLETTKTEGDTANV